MTFYKGVSFAAKGSLIHGILRLHSADDESPEPPSSPAHDLQGTRVHLQNPSSQGRTPVEAWVSQLQETAGGKEREATVILIVIPTLC